jgi:hypothetical protein
MIPEPSTEIPPDPSQNPRRHRPLIGPLLGLPGQALELA